MKSVFWCSQSSARRIASALATMSFRIFVSSTSHVPSWSIQAPRLHQSPVSDHPVPMLLLSHQHNSELPTWPFPPLPLAYNARSVPWHPYLRSYGSFASIAGSNDSALHCHWPIRCHPMTNPKTWKPIDGNAEYPHFSEQKTKITIEIGYINYSFSFQIGKLSRI